MFSVLKEHKPCFPTCGTLKPGGGTNGLRQNYSGCLCGRELSFLSDLCGRSILWNMIFSTFHPLLILACFSGNRHFHWSPMWQKFRLGKVQYLPENKKMKKNVQNTLKKQQYLQIKNKYSQLLFSYLANDYITQKPDTFLDMFCIFIKN